MCEYLCRQPEGEGKVCRCMATSRNGGTGPASAPTLTRRCSCTIRACLHIKGILHHCRESSVLMARGCPSVSTVLRGRVRALLHHTRSGEAGAAYSQWWHQCSCSTAVRGRPKWQLSLRTPDECWRDQAEQTSGRPNPAPSHESTGAALERAARGCLAPCKEQTHLPRSCPEVSDPGQAVPCAPEGQQGAGRAEERCPAGLAAEPYAGADPRAGSQVKALPWGT